MDALKASTKAFVSLLNLPPHNFAILFQFPLFHEGPNRQRQAKKGDKALGIGLIIYIVFAEGDIFLAVKGIRARRAGRNDIAFIELQTDRTGHRFLRFIDKGLEGFPQAFSYENEGTIYISVPVSHAIGDFAIVSYTPDTK